MCPDFIVAICCLQKNIENRRAHTRAQQQGNQPTPAQDITKKERCLVLPRMSTPTATKAGAITCTAEHHHPPRRHQQQQRQSRRWCSPPRVHCSPPHSAWPHPDGRIILTVWMDRWNGSPRPQRHSNKPRRCPHPCRRRP